MGVLRGYIRGTDRFDPRTLIHPREGVKASAAAEDGHSWREFRDIRSQAFFGLHHGGTETQRRRCPWTRVIVFF